MSENSITLSRGLVELKTLEDRIKKASQKEFITIGQGTGDNLKIQISNPSDFKSNVESDFQSLNALIERRGKLKTAIIKANAETLVKVGDDEMTIASAIEQKGFIEIKKSVLNNLQGQYSQAVRTLEQENFRYENSLNTVKESLQKKESDESTQALLDASEKHHVEHKKPTLVDPIDLKKVIDQMDNEITTFEAEVDIALSEVNATTYINP